MVYLNAKPNKKNIPSKMNCMPSIFSQLKLLLKLFSKPKQTQIFCWECSQTVYLETLGDYGWSVKHILTCQGIELQPEQHESDPKEDQNFEIKPSPKRLNASLFSPTSKLTITLGNILVKWNEYSVPKGRKKIVLSISMI